MSDNAHHAGVLNDLRQPSRSLAKAIPETWSAFVRLHHDAMADGELSTKMKELLALVIGVTRQCDGCIASHAKGAARAGATPGEVAEALGVALLMNGGPASVYGPRAWDAYQEFAGLEGE